jgi:CHAT domain-containing protein/tetratricopeptide (TPR) repeat protein
LLVQNHAASAQTAASPPTAKQELQERQKLIKQIDELRQAGKFDEAVPVAERLLELERRAGNRTTAGVAEALSRLAELAELRGDWSGAIARRKEALAVSEPVNGKDHWRTADARLALAFAEKVASLEVQDRVKVQAALRYEQEAAQLDGQGKFSDAERVALRALEVYRAAIGTGTAEVARVWHRIGRARRGQEDSARAKEAAELALAIRRKLLPGVHPRIADSLFNLGLDQQSLRQYAAAKASHEEALEIYRKTRPANDPDLADTLSSLGFVRYALREFAAAKTNHEEALVIRRKALPKDHPDIAQSLYDLGNLQYELRQYAAARASHEEALAIRRKILPTVHPDITYSLNNVGMVQQALREYAAAKASFEEALAIRRKALPKNDPRIADSLNNLGVVQQALREYAAATASHEEALAVRRKALPNDDPDIAQSLNNLGTLHSLSNDYAAAKASHEEALAIFRKALPKDHPLTAQCLCNLGSVQLGLREHAAARASCAEAVAIFRKTLPKDDPTIADGVYNLARAQFELREYTAARASYEEALTVYRKSLPKEHPRIALGLTALGSLQREMREYAQAKASHEEALAIFRKVLPKDHPDLAQPLQNLGNLQYDLREDAPAKASHEEALAILRKALPLEHPEIALSLNNLGSVQRSMGEYAAAKASHEEALAIRRKIRPKDHPDVAQSLYNLGIVQRELHEFAAAKASYEQALTILRKALPKDDPNIAGGLNGLGNVQGDLREYAAAKASHEEALAIYRKALPEDHPRIAQSLQNLGWVRLASGEDAASVLPTLAEATDRFQADQLHLAVAQAEPEQLAMAGESHRALSLLLTAVLTSRADPGPTYDLVVRGKGSVTAQQRWVRQARDAADSETARLLDRLRQITQEIVGLSVGGHTSGRSSDTQADSASLRGLSEERARLEQQLSQRSAVFRAIEGRARVGARELRAALSPDVALIDLVAYVHLQPPAKPHDDPGLEDRVVAFVVRATQKELAVVPLGPLKTVAELIDRWRGSHGAGKAPAVGAADPSVELRRRLWEPLASHLDGVKIVLVSPDGPLNGLPWEALPGSEEGTFLIHECAVAVAPVPQLLPELLRGGAGHPEAPASLVVGNIDFDALPEKAAAVARENRFSPLPGTMAEATAVHNLFRASFAGGPAELLSGKAATEQAFVSRATRCSHLLVATHGFFLAELEANGSRGPGALRSSETMLFRRDGVTANPALRSGLVFAGANYAMRGRGSAFLTALEASELDLRRVDLAVLSACETGMGAVQGGQGVLGLQRAFQLAGARTTVTSLWKVPDAATQALMTRFHQNLWQRKMTKLEALREAQIWMIQEGRKHPELGLRGGLERPEPKSHEQSPVSPFYWAAFVLSGDWR